MAYPYQFFHSIVDCQEPVDNLKKQDFFSNLENETPNDNEIERTKENDEFFNIKNGKQLT